MCLLRAGTSEVTVLAVPLNNMSVDGSVFLVH